jgi:hypothetical protein
MATKLRTNAAAMIRTGRRMPFASIEILIDRTPWNLAAATDALAHSIIRIQGRMMHIA